MAADVSATRMHLINNSSILHVRKAIRLDRRVALTHDSFDSLIGMRPHVRVLEKLPAARVANIITGILRLAYQRKHLSQ